MPAGGPNSSAPATSRKTRSITVFEPSASIEQPRIENMLGSAKPKRTKPCKSSVPSDPCHGWFLLATRQFFHDRCCHNVHVNWLFPLYNHSSSDSNVLPTDRLLSSKLCTRFLFHGGHDLRLSTAF